MGEANVLDEIMGDDDELFEDESGRLSRQVSVDEKRLRRANSDRGRATSLQTLNPSAEAAAAEMPWSKEPIDSANGSAVHLYERRANVDDTAVADRMHESGTSFEYERSARTATNG